MRTLLWTGVVALAGLAACGGPDVNADSPDPMDVLYYSDGERRESALDDACRERVPEIVSELVEGSTETLRLLVSEERIEEIRGGTAVEVIFHEPRRFVSDATGTHEVSRVLVPLEQGGDYVGDEGNPTLAVFLGGDGYRSGPLFNPSGLPLAQELEACARGGG